MAVVHKMNKIEYRINTSKKNKNEIFKLSKNKIERYGFCLLENIIPKNQLKELTNEIITAKKKIDKNTQKIIDFSNKGFSADYIFKKQLAELRRQRDKNRPPKAANDLIYMPKYAKAISKSIIPDLLKYLLDDHVRLSQIHAKFNKKYLKYKRKFILDTMKTPRPIGNIESLRDWHTDWPHDPWGGGANKNTNVGCVKEPFPDVLMSLTLIWYLSDIKKNGGTIVLPKSHKFGSSPRSKKIPLYEPIKNELQVTGSPGSVLIQDSRLWHSPSNDTPQSSNRIAIVNRWSPWWMSVNDYAYNSITNIVCRPMNYKEYKKIPNNLKLFFQHLCPEIEENIQRPIILRSKKSIEKVKNN